VFGICTRGDGIPLRWVIFVGFFKRKMIACIREKNMFVLGRIVLVLNRPFCINILQ
jgi:hypothetical protein